MRCSVLLIDRDEDTCVILKTVLEHNSYDVRTTSSEAEGMRLAHEAPPDLIILEDPLFLPDGSRLGSVLRHDPDLGRTRLLAISSYAESAEVEGMEKFEDAFLLKPIRLAEVLGVVRRLTSALP